MRLRIGLWALVASLVVLAARAVVYALAPSQSVLLEQLANREGGPRLAGALTAAVLAAALVAAAVLWLVVVAVRERLALEGRPLVAVPRLRPWRLVARTALLFAFSSFGFALLESYVHWRAGLGWHGLQCLLGPVHRDAIPILAALTLVAVAVHGAIEHLLAWARRVFAQLTPRARRLRNQAPDAPPVSVPRSRFTGSTVVPRGPPDGLVPVLSS